MSSYSLASYVIKINNIDVHELESLVDFEESGLDLLDILEGYLMQLVALTVDEESQTALKVRPPLNRIGRTLTGLIEGGEFGVSSQLQDVQTLAITHNRGVNEVENFPLYFLIWIPQEGRRGIVILQKSGTHGIKTPLFDALKQRFENEHDGLRLILNTLTYGKLVQQYLDEGRVTEIRLIQYESPDDITALYANRNEALSEVYTEYIIHAKSQKHIRIRDRIRDVLEGRREPANLVEIVGIDPQKVKLNIDFNGKRRTVDILDVNRVSPQLDITEEVAMAADGNPSFASIDTLARELLADLQEQLEGE